MALKAGFREMRVLSSFVRRFSKTPSASDPPPDPSVFRLITLTEMGESMEKYSMDTFKPSDPVLEEVLERANKNNLPKFHVTRMDGLHLEVFMRLGGYKKVIEVGTLAGYSGICIARGLPPDGTLDTIELDPNYAEISKESFRKAGVSNKVTVHVGEGLKVLEELKSKAPFDAIFIDADKFNYPGYLKWAERNLRIGGAVYADNTFAWGYLYDKTFPHPLIERYTKGLLEFNKLVANSPHWRSTILPTRNGLTIAVKIA